MPFFLSIINILLIINVFQHFRIYCFYFLAFLSLLIKSKNREREIEIEREQEKKKKIKINERLKQVFNERLK